MSGSHAAARRIAHGVVENIPKLKTAEKQQMVNMIDHTNLHMTTTSSDFNAVKEIVIPAEARAAKEALLPTARKQKQRLTSKDAAADRDSTLTKRVCFLFFFFPHPAVLQGEIVDDDPEIT